jgi:hypothetical protein
VSADLIERLKAAAEVYEKSDWDYAALFREAAAALEAAKKKIDVYEANESFWSGRDENKAVANLGKTYRYHDPNGLEGNSFAVVPYTRAKEELISAYARINGLTAALEAAQADAEPPHPPGRCGNADCGGPDDDVEPIA